MSSARRAMRTCIVPCVSIISGVKIGLIVHLCWGPIVALLSSLHATRTLVHYHCTVLATLRHI